MNRAFCRTEGMWWTETGKRMPLLTWGLYCPAVVTVMVLPPFLSGFVRGWRIKSTGLHRDNYQWPAAFWQVLERR